MRHLTNLTAATLAAALFAAPALASPGVATGDVNMRAGDSTRYQRITTIPEGAYVEIHGCPTWCQVTYRGYSGWVSPNYVASAGYERAPRVYYEPPRTRYYYRDRPGWYGETITADITVAIAAATVDRASGSTSDSDPAN